VQIIAILAAYNEERVLAAALDNFVRQGVGFYLIDNDSTDATVSIAERYRGRGLVGIERFPRTGTFENRRLLQRKEALALELEADWFIHADADEIRLPPRSGETLAGALERVDAEGYNAVDFFEFTFTPTRESPAHDHPRFEHTMRDYYPFSPSRPARLNAWKRQPSRVDLASSGGHVVRFPGLRMSPELFKMRHYLYLSVAHAIEKFTQRHYDAEEVAEGWHWWRSRITREAIELPSENEMRRYTSDDALDPSEPRRRHHLHDAYEAWAERAREDDGFAPDRGRR
jgi:glycosyltransferase involved in cell wall biosynthesis